MDYQRLDEDNVVLAMGGETQTKTNQLVQKTGTLLRSLMTKYWIWVVATILLAIGIAGERMTIFRIVYMALALVFILTFQVGNFVYHSVSLCMYPYTIEHIVSNYGMQFLNYCHLYLPYLLN